MAVTKADVDHMIESLSPYIKESAVYASKFFFSNNIEFELFEGIKTEMDADWVEYLYKELLVDMITNGKVFGSGYGLHIVMVPDSRANKHYTIQLGVSFPFSK